MCDSVGNVSVGFVNYVAEISTIFVRQVFEIDQKIHILFPMKYSHFSLNDMICKLIYVLYSRSHLVLNILKNYIAT